ncbi:hypothetical protein K4K55_004256 [Colletotrichum sp. SAR 10_96]|nr:hypothetical protein K4K55_004256 [Colletotrichum sp. SAR 10_96]
MRSIVKLDEELAADLRHSEIEGADKQKYMLPQHTGKGKPSPFPRYANKGTGPNNKLTYGQFQARVEGLEWAKMLPEDKAKYEQLKAPWSDVDGKTPTTYQCVDQLMEMGLNKQLKVTEFDTTLDNKRFSADYKPKRGGNPSLYNKDDPFNSAYSYFSERVEKQFQDFRSKDDPKFKAVIEKNNNLGKELLESITTLRAEDKLNHMYKQLQDGVADEKRKGLGIPKDKIVVESNAPSKVQNGKPYQNINIAQTMANAWADTKTREELQAKGFKNADDLANWANDLGNPDKTQPQDWSELNKSHFRSAKTWNSGLVKSKMTVAELSKCV